MAISKQAMELYVGKKVFLKLDQEDRVQVGILLQKNGDFFINSENSTTVIDLTRVIRCTTEGGEII
jgi:hypothetical protein